EIRKLYVNVTGQKLRTEKRLVKKAIEAGKIITKADIKLLYDGARSSEQEPGDKVYHVVNQSYTVDDETGIHNPIGTSGSMLQAEYRLIVGPEMYEEKIRTSLINAGFEVVGLVASPIAAAESVIDEEEKEAGVVVVDLGGGTTSVSVYCENVLRFLAVIPFGGNVITMDIKEGCNILLRQAESLKVQYGAALGDFVPANKMVTIPGINGWEPKEISFKSLAYIIQARMEEIVESVCFQIDKCGCADKLGAGIVLTGGGAKLEGLRQLVRFKTGMDVRVGFPIVELPFEQEKTLDSPQYATAFGLLKRAFRDENAQNDEMIPKKKKVKEKQKFSFGEAMVQKLSLFFNEDQDSEF
ncbi:MAG TPA: cell division protein FtsA, partial [Prolixibacteraceae bacterium]|nr:cell division protein FtsA [Prolixibacteraceae bacterium]